jgi:predicted DNA-binding transcriptional regulator AlpA
VQTNETKLDLVSLLETDHKKLLRANEVARILGISQETVYDWKYRSKQRNVPQGMFVKISKMLYVRSDILKEWISVK